MPAQRPRPASHRTGRPGFTLLEVLIVTVVVGILSAIAAPSITRLRTSAALQSGRAQVTGALGLAQVTGIRWGRTTTVSFDTANDLITVRVDTGSFMAPPVSLVVRQYRLAEAGVELRSNRTALCYSSRGVGVTATGCTGTGAQLIVAASGRVDTVFVNSAGRVWR